jgi:hypothetical protein
MRFTLEQHLALSPDDVAEAFVNPVLYESLGALPTLGRPEVLGHERSGDVVELRVRYHFAGHLSAAARAMIDPAKLSWVEASHHDLAARHVRFELLPDHYGDRFRSSGSWTLHADGQGTRREVTGEVVVRAMLVGSAVEGAIVSGLRDHLRDEAPLVERFASH